MSELGALLESYIGFASKCKLIESVISDLNNKDKVNNYKQVLSSALMLRNTYYNKLESHLGTLNRDELDFLIDKLKKEFEISRSNKNINNVAFYRGDVCREYYNYLINIRKNYGIKL